MEDSVIGGRNVTETFFSGERELFEHQFGHFDAGQKKGETALLPQRPAGEGVCWEVPGLSAEQLPQLTALLAAPLPQQGQGQHLFGECESHSSTAS